MKRVARALLALLCVSLSTGLAESGGAGQPGGGTHLDLNPPCLPPLVCPSR
ncbi:hypothetical protein [Deinococcus multiflagellatus]|uniref:Uncharacterized protein n=1 Tax=Deinococcus multiflagellatus TaxID=1656887 RepID=A0ABW1ZRP4_9DEIO|nr:hypothetical protein [Deinococcus multiflagellatus]MBZ9715009.1 hypothetical protein [Deinococcus multiflagellatus]